MSVSQRQGEGRRTCFWHPFADMSKVAHQELIVERGAGVWIWDDRGNRYLDSTASLWYCFIGHGRTELAEAAQHQMRVLESYSTFGEFATRPVITLAEKVASISPIPDTAVFFTSGGSESIDTAAKLVRRYWNAIGRPEKRIIVARGESYHGMAGFGTSLGGIESNTTGYGPLVEDVVVLPPDDTDAFAQLLEERAGKVAAFFGEPVRGAAGVFPPTDRYWPEIERLCRKHDVLLVVDEVITGFGRLGSWFASSRYSVVPDIIVGAKGVTSGYLPLGVVLCGPRVQEPFWNGSAGIFRHGYTYSGHATSYAVALANLEIMEKERVVEHGVAMGKVLKLALQQLEQHPLVSAIRVVETLAAIELRADARGVNPLLASQAVNEARGRGVITRNLLGHSLQISPPLVILPEEIRFMVERLGETLDAVAGKI